MKTGTKIAITVGVLALIGGTIFWMNRRKESGGNPAIEPSSSPIVNEARKYVGMQEIKESDTDMQKNNLGFKDSGLQKKMEAAGWAPRLAYCAFFVKMVMMQVCSGAALDFVKKYMNGGANATYTNLSKKNNFTELISKPEPGCLVCYKNHIEICSKVNGDGTITVISGNSNIDSSVKPTIEGIVEKIRKAGAAIDKDPFLGYVKFKKLD